jgi:hypothetical protein
MLPNPGPLIPLVPIAAANRRQQEEVGIKLFETQQNALLVKIHSHYVNLMSQSIIRMANRTIQWII